MLSSILQAKEQFILVLTETGRHQKTPLSKQGACGGTSNAKRHHTGGGSRDVVEQRNIEIGRDGVRKTQPCLEIMLPSDIRENRKGLSRHSGSKMLNKENVCPLQSSECESTTTT